MSPVEPRENAWRAAQQAADAYAADHPAVPPLPRAELESHADALLAARPDLAGDRAPLMVFLNNAWWRPLFAAVPFDRRLLLLPQCLRDPGPCPALVDEFGLLCRRCGRCPIAALQADAEALGYAVLVAEGAAMVAALIQSGKIDAILGVSCLDAMRRSFPYIEGAAIPAQAIPLFGDGCARTAVDLDAVRAALRLSASPARRVPDPDCLRERLHPWFQPEALAEVFGPPDLETRRLAIRHLAQGGKRWRPLLLLSLYETCREETGADPDPCLRPLAVAVECFHKASLIHDDIEDADEFRDGRPALHTEFGIPLALNTGDYLIGEGYRLIAGLPLDPARRAAMLSVAADGHRDLCLGQGQELAWMRRPGPLAVDGVLDMFRLKTAPAFHVALRLGALLTRHEPDYAPVLARYSAAVGIAYQIQDDLADFNDNGHRGDFNALRPSILLAIAGERAGLAVRARIEAFLTHPHDHPGLGPELALLMESLGVREEAQARLQHHVHAAVAALAPLPNPWLKCLLRRILNRMFGGQPLPDGFHAPRTAGPGALPTDPAPVRPAAGSP